MESKEKFFLNHLQDWKKKTEACPISNIHSKVGKHKPGWRMGRRKNPDKKEYTIVKRPVRKS